MQDSNILFGVYPIVLPKYKARVSIQESSYDS